MVATAARAEVADAAGVGGAVRGGVPGRAEVAPEGSSGAPPPGLLARLGSAGREALERLWASLPVIWVPEGGRLVGQSVPLAALAAWFEALSVADRQALCRAARPEWPAARLLTWLGGRLCAERALAELGEARPQVGQGGDGAPIWPAGWRGSITHSAQRVAAVVGPAAQWQALGLDSETLLDPRAAAEVLAMCGSAAERARLAEPAARAWFGLRATLLFCAKEAWFKAFADAAPESFADLRVEGLPGSADRPPPADPEGLAGWCAVSAPAAASARGRETCAARWRVAGGELHLLLAVPLRRR